MSSRISQFIRNCCHPKFGLPLFGAAALVTAGIVIHPVIATQIDPAGGTNGTTIMPPVLAPINPAESRPLAKRSKEVTVMGQLSQSKITQDGLNEAYLTVSITSPDRLVEGNQQPNGTDLVVVLDRSGSMSDPQKLPYAKSAVKKVVERLGVSDRFALVSFDDHAATTVALAPITAEAKIRINQVVDRLSAGGGTNIYEGVESAWRLLKDNPSSRTRKVILLSDGEATKGDTSVGGLRHIASQARQHEGMLSAIGMGLGFNERVMSSMADHGMGNFAYLEHLEQLGAILTKDLEDAQHTYAAHSQIQFPILPGVDVIDAAGYPVHREGNSLNISTGRLKAGATKTFTLTLKVDNQQLTEYTLNDIHVTYQKDGETLRAVLDQNIPVITVLPPEQRREAIASIDKKVYNSVWRDNNVGRMRYEINESLRRGDRAQADAVIDRYREKVQAAEAESGMVLLQSVAPELDALEDSVAEAFSGPVAEQKVKQNRFVKESHAESLKKQRKQVQ